MRSIKFFFRIICLLVLFFRATVSLASDGVSILSGKISHPIRATLALFENKNGVLLAANMYEVYKTDKQFVFALPENAGGLYYLAINAKIGEKESNERIGFLPVYIKKNESVKISLDIEDSEIPVLKNFSFPGASAENAVLKKWATVAGKVVSPWQNHETDVNAEAYLSLYKKIKPSMLSFATKNKVAANDRFNSMMQALTAAQTLFSPLLLYLSDKDLQSPENDASFKPFITGGLNNLKTFCERSITQAGMGAEMVNLYDFARRYQNQAKDPAKDVAGMMKEWNETLKFICTDTLKGYYVSNKISSIGRMDAETFKKGMAAMTQYLVTLEMRSAYSLKLDELAGIKRTVYTDTLQLTGLPALPKLQTYPGLAIIHGVVNHNLFAGEAIVTGASEGRSREFSKKRLIKGEKKFMLAIPLDKAGWYYLNCGAVSFRVFLRPGENLSVSLEEVKVPLEERTAIGYQVLEGSSENRALQQWFYFTLPATVHGFTNRITGTDTISLDRYTVHFKQVSKQFSYTQLADTITDSLFRKEFKETMRTDLEYSALLFLAYKTDKGRYNQPATFTGFKTVPDLYKTFIVPKKFCSASILNQKYGADLLDFYLKLRLAVYQQDSALVLHPADRLAWNLGGICNDTLVSLMISQSMDVRNITNLREFNQLFGGIRNYPMLPDVRKKYDEIGSFFARDTLFLGKRAISINLPDSNGNLVNINEIYKGKVVFIDTWATWCGPCKEQFPFLKQLEEHYANNREIVFVGISIDRQRDREKWKKMILKEHLPGIQLFDESGKQFRDVMMIESIPRFLLMDKQGNWVEVRCPKPDTGAKLKEYIEGALTP